MKKLVILLTLLFTLSAFCVLSACGGHTHEYTQSVTQPTCTEKGYTTYTCTCGDTYKDNYVDELNHSFTNYVYDNNATCLKDGTQTAKCDHNCGATDTIDKTGSKLEHSFTNYVYDNNATCLKDGTQTAKCDYNCGATDTIDKEGSKIDHVYENYVYDNNETCTVDGTETSYCKFNCGESDTRTKVGTARHLFTNYVYNEDATCFKDGTQTANCDRKCGTTDTIDKAGTKLKHSYTNYVYNEDATCFKDGTQTASCDHNCGTTDTIDKTGTKLKHLFENYKSDNNATYESDGTKTAYCEHGCGTTDTLPDEGSMLIRNEIKFSTLTVNGTNVSGQVNEDETSFSFENEIILSGTATYLLDNDADFSSIIMGGVVELEIGDNVFYVKQIGDEEIIYTVNIFRKKPIYVVKFVTMGGTLIANQNVEHGALAKKPDDPTRVGFNFTGWDFDFSTPITSATTITALWEQKEDAIICEVYALYGDNQPLAGVAVKLYSTTSSSGTPIALGETNEDGVYTFVLENVDLNKCGVRLGDYGITNGAYDDNKRAMPIGFELITQKVELNGANRAELLFEDIRNQFYYEAIVHLPYNRYMDTNGEIITNDNPLELVFDGEVNYKYVSFEPYVKPEGADDAAQTNQAIENATKAANGVYRIYFNTTLSGVELKYFAGSSGYVSINDDGIPNIIYASTGFAPTDDDGTIKYSGSNYIELDLNSDNCRGNFYMYVYSENAGNVTITAEWLYPSRNVEYINETVKIVDGLTKFAEQEGELTLMPITGAYDAVFNETDGFYHVGSKDGPLLVMQLNKPEERIADSAITDIPAALDGQLGAGAGLGYFTVSVRSEDGYTVNQYDFYNAIMGYTIGSETVNGYKQLANKDGVFPVNEQLKLFLSYKSFRSSHEAADGCRWLVACMYYAPEGGLELPGDGTQNNPYTIIESDENTINMYADLNGEAYIEFIADVDKFYSFEVTGNGTLAIVTENVTTYNHNGKLYASLVGGATYKLKLSASENCVIAVGQIAEKRAEYKVIVNSDESITDQSTGREEKNAITISGTGAYVIVQDNTQGPNGLYFKPTALLKAQTYKLTLYGANGKILIKTSSSSEFIETDTMTVSRNDIPVVLISTELVGNKVQDGNYLLVIENITNSN